ncbi:MAG: SLC13 family permease [Deltaproteobacteria bacterium]|jgi:di/tricarboxylate transporter|nr:SLC13 family permease [Deltaproteobacteria bacterium]
MTWQAWVTLATVAGMLFVMVRNLAGPDVTLLGGVVLLLSMGILTSKEAFAGFANEGMLTVGVLFVVAAAMRETGALDFFVRRILGRPRSVIGAQLRLMVPAAGISAFINNTPLVAAMVPIVSDWSKRIGVSASRLMMPLSWATILGGTCSLIGTSTNLVVVGLVQKKDPSIHIPLFEIAWVGIPVAIVGIAYTVLLSKRLLPDRTGSLEALRDPREYTVAMRVEAGSPVVGMTIEEAGLRHLPGLFLVDVERDGDLLPAVGPEVRLKADDQLTFAGVVESVVDLRKIRGLVPATEQVAKLTDPRPERRLVEAVVASQSPLVGKTPKEIEFRTVYNAAIIAVHRRGERVRGKIGTIELKAGDTLLLDTHPNFLRTRRNDAAFALVAAVEGSAAPRHERAWLAGGVVLAMIVANAAGWISLLLAGLLAAGALLLTRCLTADEAREAVDLRVLVAIAASFGVGAAIEQSGLAKVLGAEIVRLAEPLGTVGILAAVYLATTVLTELVTNNSAAALMFPIAMATAEAAHAPSLKPFYYVVMMAASASFSTPIGYATNLMVLSPGGYRFGDFLRFGVPLQLLLAGVTVVVVYLRWM